MNAIQVHRLATLSEPQLQALADVLLDCVDPEAERLYERLGWESVGVVPDYALLPQGGYCQTRFYYRRLVE